MRLSMLLAGKRGDPTSSLVLVCSLTLIVPRGWEIGSKQPCIKCQKNSATHFLYFWSRKTPPYTHLEQPSQITKARSKPSHLNDFSIYYRLLQKCHHHHHQWHDSPVWALAFLRSSRHSCLFSATLLQFLIPNVGLPTFLVPSGIKLERSMIQISNPLIVCHFVVTVSVRLLLLQIS